VVEPELVAQRLLDAVEHNRREVFVPRWYRIAPLAQALAPVSSRGWRRAESVRQETRISAWQVRSPPPRPFRSPSSARPCVLPAHLGAQLACRRLTPQRYLLLLMIKGAPTGASGRP